MSFPQEIPPFLFLPLLMIALLTGCYYDNEEELYQHLEAPACDTTQVTYSGFVQPLLQTHCTSCHGGSAPSGGVSLNTYTGVRSTAQSGSLVGVIAHEPGFSRMPQGQPQLPPCDIDRVRAWVNAGANDN